MTPDEIPFAKLLGIEADLVEPGHAVLSMKIRDDLLRNGGIAHGGAIATLIEQASDDVLRVEEGSLYPALHRLTEAGLLKAEWKVTDAARRAPIAACSIPRPSPEC